MRQLTLLVFLLSITLSQANDLILLETPIVFPKAEKLSDHTVRIPFELKGKLITVTASVNGDTGPFIIDTGSYAMVLNKRIYKSGSSNKSAYSVNRELENVQVAGIHQLLIDDFEINSNHADLINLSHIERATKSKINGILGYYNLKGFEIYIDFYLQQITLFAIDRKGQVYDQKYLTDPIVDTLDFDRRRHGIILEAQVNGKELKLALDTGAEINQLSKDVASEILESFTPLRRIQILGMDGTPKEAIAGNFGNFTWSNGKPCQEAPTVITTLEYAQQAYGTSVDGVVGYWFLKDRRTLINYRKKKLFFTKWPEQ